MDVASISTKARVCSFRSHHGIAVYRESEWPSEAR